MGEINIYRIYRIYFKNWVVEWILSFYIILKGELESIIIIIYIYS